jgi:hypothetical protein
MWKDRMRGSVIEIGWEAGDLRQKVTGEGSGEN